ncbi:MAG: SPASM domain-containing protein [Deltaproteobacteria bacterium]|nr:SPASM domain-containing protein [Deltaproteobacteria bacterium]
MAEPHKPADEGRDLVPPLPDELYLEVTNRCNLTCKMCARNFHYKYEPERDLTLERFRAIADQLPVLRRAVLHGIAEPLLNRELPAIIRYLKDRGTYVLFNTNGTLLDDGWQQSLIESGLDELRVSLDASTPGTFLKIRAAPVFDKILDNLRGLLAKRQARGADTPKVSIWFTAMRENIRELPGLIRLAAELAVDEVYLQRLVYFADGLATKAQSLYRSGDPEVQRLIEACEALSRELGVRFNASGATTPERSLLEGYGGDPTPWTRCHRPWSLTYITANGNVLPCCIAPFAEKDFGELILGNAFDEGVKTIWEGERYQRFRARIQTAEPPACCRGCGLCWSL